MWHTLQAAGFAGRHGEFWKSAGSKWRCGMGGGEALCGIAFAHRWVVQGYNE
ncbi:MAG: hypothetical protein PHQ60_13095 [Sideroxydans sp.]|nr:hypothetical protein [Sideroxydans sp.]